MLNQICHVDFEASRLDPWGPFFGLGTLSLDVVAGPKGSAAESQAKEGEGVWVCACVFVFVYVCVHDVCVCARAPVRF